jgi:hypothetical protein
MTPLKWKYFSHVIFIFSPVCAGQAAARHGRHAQRREDLFLNDLF